MARRAPPKLLPTLPEPVWRYTELPEAVLPPEIVEIIKSTGSVWWGRPAQPAASLTDAQRAEAISAMRILATADWQAIEAARQNYIFIKRAQAEGIRPADMKNHLEKIRNAFVNALALLDTGGAVANEAWQQFARVKSQQVPASLQLSAFNRDEIYPIISWLAHRWHLASVAVTADSEVNLATPNHVMGMVAFDTLCNQLAPIAEAVQITISAPRAVDANSKALRPSEFQRFVWQVFATIPTDSRDVIGDNVAISSAFMAAVADWWHSRRSQ